MLKARSEKKKFRALSYAITPAVDCVSYMKGGTFKSRRQRDWIDNTYDGHHTALWELISSDRALPDEIFEYKQKLSFLVCALERMNLGYAFLLIRRFGLGGQAPQSLEEIGADIGLSDTRVHFGLTAAIANLNHVTGLKLESHDLQIRPGPKGPRSKKV